VSELVALGSLTLPPVCPWGVCLYLGGRVWRVGGVSGVVVPVCTFWGCCGVYGARRASMCREWAHSRACARVWAFTIGGPENRVIFFGGVGCHGYEKTPLNRVRA